MFAHFLPQLGAQVWFAGKDSPAVVEAAIDGDTRKIYFEITVIPTVKSLTSAWRTWRIAMACP